MFPGTINRLNKEELKDLMAYMVSGANKNHEIYKPKTNTSTKTGVKDGDSLGQNKSWYLFLWSEGRFYSF
jgi:hypothetical protein